MKPLNFGQNPKERKSIFNIFNCKYGLTRSYLSNNGDFNKLLSGIYVLRFICFGILFIIITLRALALKGLFG